MKVSYRWSFEGYGHEVTEIQQIRCDNAVNRSVPFPLSWRTAIKVVAAVDRMRRDAIAEASQRIENPQCDCRLLGVPKLGADLDELCGTAGTLVYLKSSHGMRQPFLLSRKWRSDTWAIQMRKVSPK